MATFRLRLNSLCFPCIHNQFPCVFQYVSNKYFFLYKWPPPPLTAILSSLLFISNITTYSYEDTLSCHQRKAPPLCYLKDTNPRGRSRIWLRGDPRNFCPSLPTVQWSHTNKVSPNWLGPGPTLGPRKLLGFSLLNMHPLHFGIPLQIIEY